MKFKPQMTIITNETVRIARDSYGKKTPYQTKQYKTYRELKRNIKNHLQDNLESTISVARSKRGEWGEWFEIWGIEGGKPQIIKEGWQ